jgi:hypothetical protein
MIKAAGFEAETTAATGTDERHLHGRFALPLPYGGDGTGRNLSDAGGLPPNCWRGQEGEMRRGKSWIGRELMRSVAAWRILTVAEG